jgi:3-oxoacyl-[acyl-carrier protein] reductase
MVTETNRRAEPASCRASMAGPISAHPVAAVTGGLGGIGGGIVVALTQRGFDVVVCDRSIDPAAAESLEARAAPDTRLSFVSGDLAKEKDHHRFVDAMFNAFGRIDCLVNNAGVPVMSRGDLLDVSVESYDLNFAVNTRGAFFPTQAVCRRMLTAGGEFPESARSVVFTSSSNAAIAAPERGEYAMSKAAVAMMAKLYAVRLAPHGIAVYEVRPGLIRTPMTGVAQARFDKLLADGFTPINRWGTPEDVGRAVATMAAGDLPFTTGAAIQVDGGMHIHQY